MQILSNLVDLEKLFKVLKNEPTLAIRRVDIPQYAPPKVSRKPGVNMADSGVTKIRKAPARGYNSDFRIVQRGIPESGMNEHASIEG